MSRRTPRRRFPRVALAALCGIPMLVIGTQSSSAQTHSGLSGSNAGNSASHSVTIRVPMFAALSSGGVLRTSPSGQTHRVLLHGNEPGLSVSTSTTSLGLSTRITSDDRATLLATAGTEPVVATDERRRNGERAFEIPDRSDRVIYVTVTHR